MFNWKLKMTGNFNIICTGCYDIFDEKIGIGPTFTRQASFKVRFGFSEKAKHNIKEHFGDGTDFDINKKKFVNEIMGDVSKYFKALGNRAIGQPIKFEVRGEINTFDKCVFLLLIAYIKYLHTKLTLQ